MSIWSTFKKWKAHDYDLHEDDVNPCGCADEGNEIYLSQSWAGRPLRLSLDSLSDGDAHVLVTPKLARELSEALSKWADSQ